MLKSFFVGGLLALSCTSAFAQVGNTAGQDQFQELLKKADRNGDGQLDNMERAAVSKHLDEFLKKELAMKADKDGDGQLSVSERMTLKEMIDKRRADLLRKVPGANANRNQTTTPANNGTNGSNNGGNAPNNNGVNPTPANFPQPKGTPENYRGVFPGGLDGAQFPPGVRPGFSGKPDGFRPKPAAK